MAVLGSRVVVATFLVALACCGRAAESTTDAASSAPAKDDASVAWRRDATAAPEAALAPDGSDAATTADVSAVAEAAVEVSVVPATYDAGWADAGPQDAGSSCSPFPCSADQFCLDLIGSPLGGNEVQSSCWDIPELCKAAPTCECILQAVSCARQCVAQGSSLTASCWVPIASPP